MGVDDWNSLSEDSAEAAIQQSKAAVIVTSKGMLEATTTSVAVKIERLQEVLATGRRSNAIGVGTGIVRRRLRSASEPATSADPSDRSGESDARGPLGPVSDEGHDRK